MSTLQKLTIREYDAMAAAGAFEGMNRRRVELIRGEIREMVPIGFPHNALVTWMTEWSFLQTALLVTVRTQCSLGIPELESVPEPDVAWLKREFYSHRHPEPADVLLIIEVSESSLNRDLGEKKELYAQAGIVDYWVVDIDERRIHVFRAPAGDDFTESVVVAEGDTISPLTMSNVVLDVRELFSALG